MDEACKKGYHQEYYRHSIVPVIGTAFFHSGIAEGIFKQRDDLCKAGKEIKQVTKPETKIAIEVKRQHHICGGNAHGYDDQGDLAVKVAFYFAKTDYGNQNQNISQHIRHKIQSKDRSDDLINYHVNCIWRFCCKGDECGISDGGFYRNIEHGNQNAGPAEDKKSKDIWRGVLG